MNYVAIKLTTGEEIFATLDGIESDKQIIISYPFKIQRVFTRMNSRIESRFSNKILRTTATNVNIYIDIYVLAYIL